MAEHAELMGRLVVNLQSLEFAIRAYLYAIADPPHTPLASGQPDVLKVGDTVSVNAFTDYGTLGELIGRYNIAVHSAHPELEVDSSVVSIRDALAHGRIAAKREDSDDELLKFEKPAKGATTTKVTFSETLTREWFDARIRFVGHQLRKVAEARKLLPDS